MLGGMAKEVVKDAVAGASGFLAGSAVFEATGSKILSGIAGIGAALFTNSGLNKMLDKPTNVSTPLESKPTNDTIVNEGGTGKGKLPGSTVDPNTGSEVGRFISDGKGNVMIEPVGGKTVPAGKNGVDTHTTYPNGSNYQRLNPEGHVNNSTPHGHGHLEGTGPGMKGQGPSIDVNGVEVPWNSSGAHWSIK